MRISRVLSTTGKLVLSPGLLTTRTRHLFFLVYLTSFSLVFRDLNALLFFVMVDMGLTIYVLLGKSIRLLSISYYVESVDSLAFVRIKHPLIPLILR